MHNKKVKFLSILCATALVGQGMPVSAEEVTVKDEGSQSVDVTASISPDYTVTIPKSLLLDEDGSAEYTVTASGEIEKLSTLTVTPEESFVLTTRYDSATATVSQEKTSWSDTDLLTDSEKTTTGSVTVDGGLAPGEWSGTFNFEIALNEHVHEYSTTDGTTHTCSACNTSEEHDYDEGTVTTEATCTAEGVKTFKCTSCDASYTEAIPMTDHKDENSDTVCDVCSELVAGLYDENNVMTASWDELLEDGTIHVTDGVLTTNSTYIYPSTFTNTSSDILIGKLIVDDSVTSLGYAAFDLCSNLTSIVLPDTVTSIDESAFYGCSSLTSINIPDNVTRISRGAFGGCSSLTNIVIPSSVTYIGICAFANCSSLTSITIPDSVKYIDAQAFQGSSLTSITIPSSVTNIAGSVFYECDSLESIIVDSENTVYDSRDNCNAIIETATNTLINGCKNTIIPDSVTSIGDRAFGYYSSISITIPTSVTSIGLLAFSDCDTLMINYKGTEEQWNTVTKDTDWSKNSTPTINYNYTE